MGQTKGLPMGRSTNPHKEVQEPGHALSPKLSKEKGGFCVGESSHLLFSLLLSLLFFVKVAFVDEAPFLPTRPTTASQLTHTRAHDCVHTH